ncbi:integrase [Prauserella marina]|uniref:Site-specific recombinase XerD n=1 Tax=Prauserella marina TaxID=530584 RepID=A0A222VJF5_9PSEU|nr:tyrosine-type recombinase/integrase [Prauserella marina]ASR34027.1 integrase [Prauserella marina]PWV82654.1 site-specific recombinase XerD [Prauserella marina]SDC73937.1 Site-specific recombinase XerD [Prauserella marina]
METSHDVSVFKIDPYKGKKTTYRVRWRVGKRKHGQQFPTMALADSYRSQLLQATRKGEWFDTETGLPSSMIRTQKRMSWFDFACTYIDMKWTDSSPKYRKSLAESLTRITVAMLKDSTSLPADTVVRAALMKAFNTNMRKAGIPQDTAQNLNSIARVSRDVSDLAKPDVLRSVLHALDLNLDGARAAPNTVRLRRIALGNAIDYALERELLASNPLSEVKTKKRSYTLREVDPECAVNPMQARMLLDAVSTVGKRGPRLVAFFACLYYAGLRPEEAANLKKQNLALPEQGWGGLNLNGARPEVGAEWTDSGEANEEGPLKHREASIGRLVPAPPPLTEALHTHLTSFGTAPDGRLFRGTRDGGRIGSTTYGRVWATARERVFTAEVLAGPLGKRPYDLRHACVSTWLTGGVEPTRVAKWAGHSVAVLLKVYAKCLDGGEAAARDRVERALQGW